MKDSPSLGGLHSCPLCMYALQSNLTQYSVQAARHNSTMHKVACLGPHRRHTPGPFRKRISIKDTFKISQPLDMSASPPGVPDDYKRN